MPLIKTVGYFECRGYGWSEAWLRNTSATSLEQIRDEVEPMWQKRFAVLGTPCVFQSYRVSREDVEQDGLLTYKNQNSNAAWTAASPQLALVTRFYNSTRQRKKDVFVRGFDDRISDSGGAIVFPVEATAFWQAWTNWQQFITAQVGNQNPYGWYTRTVVGGVPKVILNYEPDPDGSGRVNFNLEAAAFPVEQVNTYQRVGVVKLGPDGKSILNGDQVVYVLAQNIAQTTYAIATFPWMGTLGGMKRYAFEFQAATPQGIAQKIGKRSAGKISHVTPGRAKVKPKG